MPPPNATKDAAPPAPAVSAQDSAGTASPDHVPRQAMVFAAGLGTRMRPLTDDRPKPLVEIFGKPLIDHILDRLAAAGVEETVVNVHYMADMLEAHLAKRVHPRIVVSDERAYLLDTGGGLKKAWEDGLIGDAPILYANSDTVWVDGMGDAVRRLAAAWRPDAMDALMLLAPMTACTGYAGRGDFQMDREGRLSRRTEGTVAPFVWMGVQIIDPKLLEDTPPAPFSTNLLWNKAIAAGRLYGIRHDGLWMHVGSPDGIAEAQRAVERL
jgi:MurNAc alpha-1-phosphate uridylyltransferase